MCYLTIGYYVVCLSPLLSILVYIYVPELLVGPSYDWLHPMMVYTGIHTLIIGVQLCGIFLYLLWYRNERIESKQLPFVRLSSVLLILWGGLVGLFVAGFWNKEVLPWSRLPGVRGLIIWDYLQFVSWALKGFLWIASGLLFLVIFQFQRHKKS